MQQELEKIACNSLGVKIEDFNQKAILPYGLKVEHIHAAMNDFSNFLRFLNTQLYTKSLTRLEGMLMPANFSSMVGEFMGTSIPQHCPTIVKNQYHNGHPDLIEKGRHPKDAIQYHVDGIEIKGSRYMRGWQGHNPEDCWLMVFVFDSNRPVDPTKDIAPKPFRFRKVVGAKLEKKDWLFAGRSETSRRTITAAVTKTGYQKMMDNWIYISPTESNSSSLDEDE